MRHSTLRQLEVFSAIARLGSFTRAAEELFLTQPTVSMQIKKLTDAVGLPLFEQIGKKIYLTDAGRELQQTCGGIFEHFSRFEMTIADMKGLKIRVPDVPAYLAMPRACGANTAPIAFAEVYLALQNGTVEAQENPLTTIEAKKFYEVQKHIVLTGHIVDHLNTVVAKQLWDKLSPEDRKIFSEVAQEASARATKQIQASEAKLVQFFKDKGLTVTEVDKAEFLANVQKNVTFEQFGYRKADWERIQAIK
ncbi:MAG: hypothetical protein B7Z40_02770 [Bosea sp. 12-68-7]|nr:MAG: hypothetical protein B7Z40_02770 [Bosea sp. 12-68-7]